MKRNTPKHIDSLTIIFLVMFSIIPVAIIALSFISQLIN